MRKNKKFIIINNFGKKISCDCRKRTKKIIFTIDGSIFNQLQRIKINDLNLT